MTFINRATISTTMLIAVNLVAYASRSLIGNPWNQILWVISLLGLLLLLDCIEAIISTFVLVAMFIVLSYANSVKIDLTAMPLTMDDVLIALSNIPGLIEASPAPALLKKYYWSLYSLPAILMLYIIYRAYKKNVCYFNLQRFSRKLLVLMVPILLFCAFTKGQFEILESSEVTKGLWSIDANVKLSKQIGIVPYLNYTYYKRNEKLKNTIFDLGFEDEEPIDGNEPIYTGNFKESKRPNVVFMLLESTVDVSKIFDIKSIETSPLFSSGEKRKLLSKMRVNAIGGGTWLTEFETITGVDSRVFGYNGYYTHSSISPYVKKAFPHYMKELGYVTSAYYPVDGAFYNAKNAYKNYGFDNYYDSNQLGVTNHWDKFSDSEYTDAILKKISAESFQNQFFAYIVTLQNHSPHECVNFKTFADFKYVLKGTHRFEENCRLNEFQLRLKSTYSAVVKMYKYLSDIEAKTGRPFILVTFGDHLPHTFVTQGAYASVDYSELLDRSRINDTFVRIDSSLSGHFNCCTHGVPDFLVPTLVSSMIEKESSKIYLYRNFQLFNECGINPVGRILANDIIDMSQSCMNSYKASLIEYRKRNFKLGE